ncbi:MAG: ATP-binding protein [Fibrobacterales bacterium]|nr:ATP-binding protein [Fibrobacterales bacterium]
MNRRTNNKEKCFSAASAGLPSLAASLDRIFKKVNETGLGDEASHELEKDIESVAGRFGISPKAVVLLAAVLEHNARNGCDDDDLSQYIGCSNIEFIGFRSAIRELEDLDIVNRRSRRGDNYVMSREALRAVEKDTDFVPMKRSGLGADEFFSRVRLTLADFDRDRIDCDRLLEELERLIAGNQHLLFCRKAAEALATPGLCDTEKRFFLLLCHRYVSHGEESFPIDRLLAVSDYMEDDKCIRRTLTHGKSTLQESGLVTFGGAEGFQDTDSLALSDEIKRTFFTEVTPAKAPETNHRDLVRSSAIKPKELFYDGSVAEQMERLASLLEPEHFAGVQARLAEMGMRKGFAVLFTGGAGCGKTAGVYELARRTGRDVFAVDMSQLKSKWVGDSEKIVKGVFTTYREMCRTRDLAPILLFNEADAIFSRRMENPQDSVDQMMNAIQNIILQELENLEGILVATTNLASNFCDDAFARRFLFKVEFDKPEAATRAKIWKSMLQDISGEDALALAGRYDFSGGNIENVARKAAVGYVLSGRKAGLDELVKYCDEETLSSQKTARRIGFNA